ncbi:PhzF family phenazine biosynthesis isomerase, partial [Dyella sp. ASV21]|uniref:PhzF family phenazine biosynthesis protein n=1 Tax=Dyella sp. ASV21 TaxID=2795114 RepID=UPI0018EC5307
MPVMFQLDSFTTHRFSGNPAAVVVLDAFPMDEVMQAVAAENNLAETAFLVADGPDYRLRWFTPLVEVPLCGHGTLASAAVVMERLERSREQVTFHTASGPLYVQRRGASYVMDFPVRHAAPVAMPADVLDVLGVEPLEFLGNEFNYLAVLDSARTVRRLQPNLAAIALWNSPG